MRSTETSRTCETILRFYSYENYVKIHLQLSVSCVHTKVHMSSHTYRSVNFKEGKKSFSKNTPRTSQGKVQCMSMSRWSSFHAPVHSTAFAMDRQFCRRDMDTGIKKDIWSVMEDFAKPPGDKDLTKMKSQYQMFVDVVDSNQVTV